MMAAVVGVMRQINNIRGNHRHLYGGKKNQGWQYHIEGALGECAVAKYLDIYWHMGEKGGDDVGNHQVRTTPYEIGRLIIHPQDEDDVRYYLAVGCNGRYVIKGWILGRDGKREEFWDDPTGNRPAYFVPQKNLEKGP